MKIFISYSLDRFEDSTLSDYMIRLKDQGVGIYYHGLYSSNGGKIDEWSVNRSIRSSSALIGIIGEGGADIERVLESLKIAKEVETPVILLIENSVSISDLQINNSNVIIFDRNDPNKSIDAIREKAKKAQQKTKTLGQSVAWMLIELAVELFVETFAHQKQEAA